MDSSIAGQCGRTRSSFLRLAAGAGTVFAGGLVFGRGLSVSQAAPSPARDRRIFQFALLLEQLQAAFYSEALERGALRGDLREFAKVDIDPANPRYREPLERDLARLARASRKTEVVLLGSVASGKYVEILLDHIGDRLVFPETFVGRGDMSRGGVMLRAARQGEELTYIRAAGAVRRGTRPPKLEPIARV